MVLCRIETENRVRIIYDRKNSLAIFLCTVYTIKKSDIRLKCFKCSDKCSDGCSASCAGACTENSLK